MGNLKEASDKRSLQLFEEDIDRRVDLLLANYQRVTANPRSMGYLRFLLRHYGRSATPWTDCVRDNTKRFGPDKVKGLCGVLKDTIRQTTYWRGKRGHSKVPDVGDPGYVIGEADKGFAPPWGGHHHLSDSNIDMGIMSMPDEVAEILEDLGEKCDVYRVLIGLDDPPKSDLVLL